jgi:hypothetical protein
MRFRIEPALRACAGGAVGCAVGAALGDLAGTALTKDTSGISLPVTDAAVTGLGNAVRVTLLVIVGGILGAATGIACVLRRAGARGRS